MYFLLKQFPDLGDMLVFRGVYLDKWNKLCTILDGCTSKKLYSMTWCSLPLGDTDHRLGMSLSSLTSNMDTKKLICLKETTFSKPSFSVSYLKNPMGAYGMGTVLTRIITYLVTSSATVCGMGPHPIPFSPLPSFLRSAILIVGKGLSRSCLVLNWTKKWGQRLTGKCWRNPHLNNKQRMVAVALKSANFML